VFWQQLGLVFVVFAVPLVVLMVGVYRSDRKAATRLRRHVLGAGEVQARPTTVWGLRRREGADAMPMYPGAAGGRLRPP